MRIGGEKNVIEILKWYECTKCRKQGYTNVIPDPEFQSGRYLDGPMGQHKWDFIGEWKTDKTEYPKEDYDISK